MAEHGTVSDWVMKEAMKIEQGLEWIQMVLNGSPDSAMHPIGHSTPSKQLHTYSDP